MAAQKVGDRIISKRNDGAYDILQISGERIFVSREVPTLDEARLVARADLPDGGQVWYRHHEDNPDHLELL